MCSRVSQLSDNDSESARLIVASQSWKRVRVFSEVELRASHDVITTSRRE